MSASKWRLTKKDEQEIQEKVGEYAKTLCGTQEENEATADAFRQALVQEEKELKAQRAAAKKAAATAVDGAAEPAASRAGASHVAVVAVDVDERSLQDGINREYYAKVINDIGTIKRRYKDIAELPATEIQARGACGIQERIVLLCQCNILVLHRLGRGGEGGGVGVFGGGGGAG